MADAIALKAKVDELGERDWDDKGIEARIRKLMKDDIPKKKLDPEYMKAHKAEILAHVERLAEEYNYFLKNCAQGTALALFEEFGIGSMQIIKALTPFPGIGGTGDMCGGVTGSLMAIGLFFGIDDRTNPEHTSEVIEIAQRHMAAFEGRLGYLYCADIIENIILGYTINPGQSERAMIQFGHDKGFEKCGLPPGTGVKIAAEFIIDNM